ncbi:hypothetical protein DPEC_G00110260 [Dallia pectoralis]|uniref:Uncharacterized protein n=1 Tax=Dallia pectoralis TaxID=75939 RepID=A0ACC2GT37_DALPE|nr:hypothetical protein DPEC_G00110260 [Dallia pectoralis]
MANPLRSEVLKLYRNLLYLGQEYPKGPDYFRECLKSAFKKNKDVKDPIEIRNLVDQGESVIKELGNLYYLREYRDMKKLYHRQEMFTLLNVGRLED